MLSKTISGNETGKEVPSGPMTADSIFRKVFLRIIPLLMACFLIAYLDRINVGFAKLQMQSELKLSDTVYGLGAGIFFIGYLIFEVPSNILLARIGARKTITRIMICWGIVGALMSVISTANQFYILRFLLGAFEAGFFPGVIYYLTTWFPSTRRAHILGLFMTGFPIAGMIGGPISGWVMSHLDGAQGLAGWQWLYIVESVPAILFGLVIWFGLSDSFEHAKWLNTVEREILRNELLADRGLRRSNGASLRTYLRDPMMWLICFAYFTFICGTYTLSFWLPSMLKEAGVKSVEEIGWLTAIPFGIAAVGMVLICRSSDYFLERRWHGAVCAMVGAISLSMLPMLTHSLALVVFALTIASITVFTSIPLVWSIASDYFSGTEGAATTIAFVNCVALVGGFISPFAIGWLKDLTGSMNSGLFLMTGLLALGSITMLALRDKSSALRG